MSKLRSRLSIWETRIQEKKVEASKSFIKPKDSSEKSLSTSPSMKTKDNKFNSNRSSGTTSPNVSTSPIPNHIIFNTKELQKKEQQLSSGTSSLSSTPEDKDLISMENIQPVDKVLLNLENKNEEEPKKLDLEIKSLSSRGSVRNLIQSMEAMTPRKKQHFSPRKVQSTSISQGKKFINEPSVTNPKETAVENPVEKKIPNLKVQEINPEKQVEKKIQQKIQDTKVEEKKPQPINIKIEKETAVKSKTIDTKSIVTDTLQQISSPRRKRRTTITPRKGETTPRKQEEKKRAVTIVHTTSDKALTNPNLKKQEKSEEEVAKHVDDLAKLFQKSKITNPFMKNRISIRTDSPKSFTPVTPREVKNIPTKPKDENGNSSPRIFQKISQFERLAYQGIKNVVNGVENFEYVNPLADEFFTYQNELFEEAVLYNNPLADEPQEVINPLYDGERNYFGFEEDEQHESLVLLLRNTIEFITVKQKKSTVENMFSGQQLYDGIKDLSQHFISHQDIEFLINDFIKKFIVKSTNLEKDFSLEYNYQFSEDRSKTSYFPPPHSFCLFEPQNDDYLLRTFDYNFVMLCDEFSIISKDQYNNTIEYATLGKSKNFYNIEGLIYKFQKLDPNSLEMNWKKSLFLNLYNFLNLWCTVKSIEDGNNTFVKRAKKIKKCRINIGLFEIHLAELEKSILGCDKNYEIEIENDLRMDFCLHKGTVSSPVLRFYSHSTVEDRMEEATKFFISNSTELLENSIKLHSILEDEKFGKTKLEKLEFVSKYIHPSQDSTLQKFIKKNEGNIDELVSYQPYDFSLNQKGMKEALSDINFEFEQIISNPKYRVYFKSFCEKEFSTENILAWENIIAYRNLEDPSERFHKAISIFNLFLAEDAPKLININRRPCDAINAILDIERSRLFEDPSLDPNLGPDLFEDVEKSLSTTMVDTYSRFKKEDYHELAKVIMDEKLDTDDSKKNKTYLNIFKQKRGKTKLHLPIPSGDNSTKKDDLSARDGRDDVFVVKKKKRGTEMERSTSSQVISPRHSDNSGGSLSSPREPTSGKSSFSSFRNSFTSPRSKSSKNLVSGIIPISEVNDEDVGPPKKNFMLDSPSSMLMKKSPVLRKGTSEPIVTIKDSESSDGSNNNSPQHVPMHKKRLSQDGSIGTSSLNQSYDELPSPLKLNALKKSDPESRSPKKLSKKKKK
eukprot:gene4189-7499_t